MLQEDNLRQGKMSSPTPILHGSLRSHTFTILGCKQSWVQSAPKYNLFDTDFIVRHCWSSVVERKIEVCWLDVVKIKFVTKQVTLFVFVYFFGGLECVGHSIAYVAHL
jgi:hypothetical protein